MSRFNPANYLQYVGKTYNHWTVIGPAVQVCNPSSTTVAIKCQCGPCGGVKYVNLKSLLKSRSRSCKACQRKWQVTNTPSMVLKSKYDMLRRDAARRGHAVRITMRHLDDLYAQQKGRCAITGVALSRPAVRRECYTDRDTASVDRIDSRMGYVKGNIQWVHKVVNRMKGTLTPDEFRTWCQLVVQPAAVGAVPDDMPMPTAAGDVAAAPYHVSRVTVRDTGV